MLLLMRAVKRRVRPRREDVRDRILDAALEVFAAAGFAGATIDAIGQAAGFTKGAVYSNFGSKDELFLALLDRQFEQRGAVIAGAFGSGGGDLAATTQAVSRSMLDSIHAQRAYHLVYFEYWLRAVRDPQLRDQLVERSRAAAEQAVQVVAQAGPTLSEHQLAGLAKLFVAMTTGIAMEEILQPGGITDADLERLLTALLVATPAQ